MCGGLVLKETDETRQKKPDLKCDELKELEHQKKKTTTNEINAFISKLRNKAFAIIEFDEGLFTNEYKSYALCHPSK